MAASGITYSDIVKQLRGGKLSPVYLLHGEEGYYIDRLVEEFENAVPADERDFNLYVLYGPETTPQVVMETCSRYPMMSDRVVVILKEAQSMRADALDRLSRYVSNPSASTVLVIACRGAKAKGKDLLAAVKKAGGVNFESQKLNDRTVGPVIAGLIKAKGLNIEQKGMMMLRDFIGNDVSRLYNEIDKLAMVLGQGAMVTPEAIERNIGVSKDYNSFELVDALSSRNSAKAFRIIAYFKANPKSNPAPMVVAAIYNFFSNLIIMQFSPDKSPSGLAAAAGFRNSWQLKSYEPALRSYNAFQSMEIISAIRQFDTRSKGVGSRQNEHDLLKDLIFRILTAPGHITI